ncbi:MAG: LamG-like jellyroll fold domain-containing protein [Verrucomicrobiaceae bacterium]
MKTKLLLLITMICNCEAAKLAVNFTGGRPTDGANPTEDAFDTPVVNWNNLAGATGTDSVIIADNDDTALVTWARNNTWSQNGAAPVGGDAAVLFGYLDDGGNDDPAVTISGMASLTSESYTVRILSATDLTLGGTTFDDITVNSTTLPVTNLVETTGTGTTADTLFTDISGDTINFDFGDNVAGPSPGSRGCVAAIIIDYIPLAGPNELSEDFTGGDGGFMQTSDGAPENPWVFNSEAAAWRTDGEASGTSTNHFLTIPLTTVRAPLTSPPVVRITFEHRYSMEADWDAGALQLKVNDGPFETVAGIDFTGNGYTNTQALQGVHALTGADGFTGDSPGVGDGTSITSIADVKGLAAGDLMTFRFVAAFDQGSKGAVLPNWEISSVSIETLSDNDGDGMPNSYEIAYDFLDQDDPSDAALDEDNDMLTNLEEFLLGTTPNDDDTDDDNLIDGVETNTGIWVSITNTGTDPFNPDTDGDGLGDGVENPDLPYDPANAANQPGTNPNLINTDGDPLPDNEEIAFGTDPTDADSFPDFAEFLLFHYDFDTETGPIIDSSGRGAPNMGTPSNGPSHRFGEASLTGEDDGFSIGLDAPGTTHPTGSYLTVPNAPESESFSFSIWIKPNYPGNRFPIFSSEDNFYPANGEFFSLDVTLSGELEWVTGGVSTIFTEPGLINDGEVYHIVVTHLDTDGRDTGSADMARLYVNGVMVAEQENPTEIPSYELRQGNTTGLIWVGTRSAGPGSVGEFDDFQAYGLELSADQVAAMYATPGSFAPFGPPPRLEVTAITAVENGGGGYDVSLTWNSKPGVEYFIESYSTSTGTWIEQADAVGDPGLETMITFNQFPREAIYRVRRGDVEE